MAGGADAAKGSAREAKAVGTNLLTLIAQAALPAFHVQLARFLGAGGYGLYTWSNAFVDTFSIFTLLGMDQAVQRQVALATADADEEKTVRAVGTALRVVLASGVLVASALWLTAPAIASFQEKPGLAAPLRFLALIPIFYHAATVFLVATQAKHVMRWDFWARGVIQPLSLLAITTVVLRAGGGVGAAAAAVAGGIAITAAAAAYFYSREFPLGRTLRAVFTGKVDWDTVKLALPLVLTGLVWSLQGRLDAFFLGHFRGSEEMGAYGACVLYVMSISQLRGAFSPVVCAMIPPALARKELGPLNESIQRQTRWLALAALPLCVLFAGFGDGLLVVFGHEFQQGAVAMAVLALGHTFNALALAAFALPMSGNGRYGTIAAVITLLLQCVLLPVLIPRYGLTGAAISTAIGFFVAQTLQMTFAWRIVGVHGLSWGLLRVAMCALVAFVVGRIAFVSLGPSLLVRFFAGVGIAAAVYAVIAFAFGMSDDERASVREFVRGTYRKLHKRGAS